ncbi:MAG: hypothetical protein OWQ55_00605 [Sulfuracidifex metallicus]|nr:hypothetical protein [Sulfuracidifex metallicus]
MKDIVIALMLTIASLPLAKLNISEALFLPSIYILIRMLRITFSS